MFGNNKRKCQIAQQKKKNEDAKMNRVKCEIWGEF